MSQKQKLMQDFPPVSREQWDEKIIQDLKGTPYEKLNWKNPEKIDVKPYYRADDLEKISWLKTMPGEFPFVRSGKKYSNDWEIRQDIDVENCEEANKKALQVLNRGVTSLGFIIPDHRKVTKKDFQILLKDIYFDCINLNFITGNQANDIYQLLLDEVKTQNINPEKITGSINSDPLSELSTKGNLSGFEEKVNEMSELVKSGSGELLHFRMISLNGHSFHNAGASIVQELAFTLSMLSEYMDRLSEAGIDSDTIARSVQVNFSTGPVYFMEIAKIRAARILFSQFLKAWGLKDERNANVYIHSTTSEWNQTIYDPYVNMLRGTTEGMSAALGGVNSLTVVPFDRPFRKPTDFAERIARNTQIILKEEAYFDKVVDPAAGSYYIENLTDSIAENAWKLFLETEDKNGYSEALKSGFITGAIEETSATRDMNIAMRKEILVGTNKYPNQDETSPDDIEKEIAFPTEQKIPEIPVLKKYRGAAAFEKLRLQTERFDKTPLVFLLTYGSLSLRKARAEFAYGFFSCAGYKLINNNGFTTIDEGIEAAAKHNADVIVFCSSDEEYAGLSSEHITKTKETAIPVIAGNPKEHEEYLKKAGIMKFIHIRSNILEELQSFQKLMGIQ